MARRKTRKKDSKKDVLNHVPDDHVPTNTILTPILKRKKTVGVAKVVPVHVPMASADPTAGEGLSDKEWQGQAFQICSQPSRQPR